MRPSSLFGTRGPTPYVFALLGFAYLIYKKDYFGLDAPNSLKAFIVLPGVVLLVVAAYTAFPDVRQRVGGILLSLGLVALLWTATQIHPREGFYGSALQPGLIQSWISIGTLLIPLGLALVLKKAPVAGLLLGFAGILAVVAPSRFLLSLAMRGDGGMPRRYHYYYISPERSVNVVDAAIPATLAIAGIGWMFVRIRR